MKSFQMLAGILLGISAFFYGCDRLTPLPKNPPERAAPSPNRDELYVFPHGRLSMNAYEVLRSDFPKLAATDLARMAMIAQWLGTETGVTDLQKITRCVRVLFKPDLGAEDRRQAEQFLREHLKIASVAELQKSSDDASRKWAIEWNPSLVREYGISISN